MSTQSSNHPEFDKQSDSGQEEHDTNTSHYSGKYNIKNDGSTQGQVIGDNVYVTMYLGGNQESHQQQSSQPTQQKPEKQSQTGQLSSVGQNPSGIDQQGNGKVGVLQIASGIPRRMWQSWYVGVLTTILILLVLLFNPIHPLSRSYQSNPTPTPVPTINPTPTPAPTTNPTVTNTLSPTSPTFFMEGYCNAMKNGNAQDVYGMETINYQRIETLEQIKKELAARPIEKCELGQPPSDDSSLAPYSITFFPFDSQPHTYTETLKVENGAWKIDGSRTDS